MREDLLHESNISAQGPAVLGRCIVAGHANKVGLRPRVSVKQASPTRRRPESADTLQFFMSSTTLSIKQSFKKKTILFRSALQMRELELKLERQE